MSDDFANQGRGTTGPTIGPFAITPADGSDMSSVIRSAYVGGAGNVAVRCARTGNDVVFVGLAAGALVPPGFYSRVLSTGTTATDLIGLP